MISLTENSILNQLQVDFLVYFYILSLIQELLLYISNMIVGIVCTTKCPHV